MFHENCELFALHKLPKLHENGSYIKKKPSQSAYSLIVNELLNAFNVLPPR